MSAKIDSYSPPSVRTPATRGANPASGARPAVASGASSSKPVAAIEPNDHVELTVDVVTLQQFQKAVAEAPAGDRSRVERVKQAIASGSYTIDPKKIAARLSRLDGELGTP